MGSCPLDERAAGIREVLLWDGPAESRLGLVDDIVLGVCFRQLDQGELLDDAFFR